MLPTVVVAADYAGTLVLSDRTDVRARATFQGAAAPGAQAVVGQGNGATFAFDLVNTPQAAGQITDRRWTLRLDYQPSFTLPDLEMGFTPQVYNTGVAGIAWQNREVRLSLTESASFGQVNSGYLFQPGVTGQPSTGMGMGTGMGMAAGGTQQSTQLAASPQNITFVMSNTVLRGDYRFGNRNSAYASASYLVSGGLNTALLPEQYGPRFELGFTHIASRRDQFVTLGSAQAAIFTEQPCVSSTDVVLNELCNPQVDLLQLTEGVRHSFDLETNLEIDGGASLVRSRQKDADPFSTTVYPAGLVALTHSYRGRDQLTLRIDASYQPVIDARSGFTNDRLQADLSLGDSLNRVVRLVVTARGAQTIPTDAPLAASLVGGEVDLDILLSKVVRLSLGDATQWQEQQPYGAFFSTYGFFAVTVATHALRF
jgi:hypothetical protein